MKRLAHLSTLALTALTAVGMIGALWMIFLYATEEKVMGALWENHYVDPGKTEQSVFRAKRKWLSVDVAVECRLAEQ